MQATYPDALQSFQEGGWVMFVIFALGLPGFGAAVRFAWKGEYQLVNYLRTNVGAVLLASCFGFVVGVMRVLWHLTERVEPSERGTVALIGLREAANNLSLGLFFCTLCWALLAIGYRRFPAPNPSSVLNQ